MKSFSPRRIVSCSSWPCAALLLPIWPWMFHTSVALANDASTGLLGSGSVTITAGGSQRIQLTLNATGKRLLSKHNPLKAKLSVSHAGRTITSTTVKFSSKPAKGR